MKNVLILLFLVFYGVASGQIINFPDANFKDALVKHGDKVGLVKFVKM